MIYSTRGGFRFDFDTIDNFDNVKTMFEFYNMPMNENQAEYFDTITDYEPIRFHVINGQHIIVCSINGDVLAAQALDEFYQDSIDYYIDHYDDIKEEAD